METWRDRRRRKNKRGMERIHWGKGTPRIESARQHKGTSGTFQRKIEKRAGTNRSGDINLSGGISVLFFLIFSWFLDKRKVNGF